MIRSTLLNELVIVMAFQENSVNFSITVLNTHIWFHCPPVKFFNNCVFKYEIYFFNLKFFISIKLKKFHWIIILLHIFFSGMFIIFNGFCAYARWCRLMIFLTIYGGILTVYDSFYVSFMTIYCHLGWLLFQIKGFCKLVVCPTKRMHFGCILNFCTLFTLKTLIKIVINIFLRILSSFVISEYTIVWVDGNVVLNLDVDKLWKSRCLRGHAYFD